MKKCFATLKQPLSVNLALLLLRVVVGYAFIRHGTMKIQSPFHWMGAEATVPGIFQALAALSEFGGGIALILGVATRLAAFGITCTMAVAMYMHCFVFGDPFINMTGGRSFEPAAVYFLIAVVIMAIGPGRYSVDHKIFGEK